MSWAHRDFCLNGHSFSSKEELVLYAKKVNDVLYNFLVDWFSADDFVAVQTSGSTGKPKKMLLRKAHMKNSARTTGEFFNILEKTSALCCLPIEFIAGKMMVVRAVTLGWHLDVIRPSSSPLFGITKKYNFCAMVPLQLRNSVEQLHLIDQLIVGGAPVSEKLQECLQSLSTRVYATYGMTETITHIAVRPLNHISKNTKKSNYQVLPGISISKDQRSCLVIDAPKILDQRIITNDVVDIVSKRQFQWKGRFDLVVNSGGIKLHPEAIERKLAPHIPYRFFVVGIPDKVLGERLVLVIEGKLDCFSLDKFKNFNTLLHPYEIPKEVFFVAQFKETSNRKVLRKESLKQVSNNKFDNLDSWY